MAKNILVTGGCGFIGSHFIRHLLENYPGCRIINLDNLSYAGDLERLRDIAKEPRYEFIRGDIRKTRDISKAFSRKIDIVVHFAAESHVDNSIRDPFVFEEVNVRGTLNLLGVARQKGIKKFIHISTDEVYGEVQRGRFGENSPLAPNSPYSASKAAADFFVRAHIRTYKFPALLVRPCNNYGPWQYPEKFIPVAICSLMKNRPIPVYGRGLNCREWLYVGDTARAIALLMSKGRIGEIYNVGSGSESRNVDLARKLVKLAGKSGKLIKFVTDRLGHDFRYALDSSKIRRLGWKPAVSFDKGLQITVNWHLEHEKWLFKKQKSP